MSLKYRILSLLIAQEEILNELGEVAEGVYSAKSIVQISKKHNLYTPIAFEVQAILEGGAVQVGLKNLLANKPR